VIGQGKMSLGGGGFGGGGLPYPEEVLELWGGKIVEKGIARPAAPIVEKDDGTGKHLYALIAVGPSGNRTPASETAKAAGLATLRWDSVAGADAYIILRDGKEITEPLRMEGSQKHWRDQAN
jgi:hypothetical protein